MRVTWTRRREQDPYPGLAPCERPVNAVPGDGRGPGRGSKLAARRFGRFRSIAPGPRTVHRMHALRSSAPPPPSRAERVVESIYSRFASEGGELARDTLETLRTYLTTLADAPSEAVPRSLWDTLIRLFDLSGHREDVLAVWRRAIESGLGNDEALVRTMGIVGEALGDRVAYEALSALPEHRKRSPEVQAAVARFECALGLFDPAAIRAGAVLERAPDTPGLRGVLVLALAGTDRIEEACEVVLGSDDAEIDFPWAVLSLLDTLHRSGERHERFVAITNKLLQGRGPDRTYWQMRILEQIGDLDEVRAMLGALLREDPANRRWNIELAKLNLRDLAWAENREHFRTVLEYPEIMRGTRERIDSALRYLDYVSVPSADDETGAEGVAVPDSLFEYVLGHHRNVLYRPVPGRVALVGHTMGPGGAERVLGVAFKGLKRRGLDVSLWLYALDPAASDDFFLNELAIDRDDVAVLPDALDVPEPFRWLPHGHARNAYRLYLRILEDRPEVVHGWQDHINIDLVFAAVLAGVRKIVLHPHNMQPDLVHRTEISRCFRRVYRAALKRPEVHLLCVSEASRRDYLRWTGHPSDAGTSVVYNGFDLRALSSEEKARRRGEACELLGIPSDRFIVGAAFRFADVKRPLLWVEIAAALHERLPEAHFVIFGDGELRGETERLIRERGLQDRFTLPGRVQDVPSRIALFDAYLLTSRSEGLPTVAIEAQFAGVPVVGSAEGGTAECFIDGETGHVVVSDRVEDYVDALLDVHEDERMRRTVVENAVEFLEARFTEERMVGALADLYESGWSAPRRPRRDAPGKR